MTDLFIFVDKNNNVNYFGMCIYKFVLSLLPPLMSYVFILVAIKLFIAVVYQCLLTILLPVHTSM